MEYAVFRSGGKQYRVKSGDILEVDKLAVVKDSMTTFEDVLLWVSDGQVKIGTPNLENVRIKAKVLDQIKGVKVRVAKFKAKARYRRVTGFRALLTKVQIERIEIGKGEKSLVEPTTRLRSTKKKSS